jgi:2Fe-2S ferredoxin
MPAVIFKLPTGETRTVDVAAGTTVMMAAVKNDVDGIIGECGGVCMCATCHVYVRQDFFDRLPPAQDTEEAVLEVTNAERLPNSRLSCQIKMTADLDGLTVDVPPSQR